MPSSPAPIGAREPRRVSMVQTNEIGDSMSCYRFFACVGALAVLFAAQLSGQTYGQAGQAPKTAGNAKSQAMRRTPDGHPDLQGVWTNATITPMERPSRFNGKA